MAGESSRSPPSPTASSPAPAESPRGRSEAVSPSPPASPPRPGATSTAEAPLQVPGNVELVADPDNADDGDGASLYSSTGGSETTSLASSILSYRLENGRTYHSYKRDEGAAYWLPNDDTENDRLDLQHHIMVLMQGGQLYLCPAGKDGKPLRRVLDVGTGTGVWAMEFGMSLL